MLQTSVRRGGDLDPPVHATAGEIAALGFSRPSNRMEHLSKRSLYECVYIIIYLIILYIHISI